MAAALRGRVGPPPSAPQGLATSDDEFDRWFRSHLLAVHGIDLAAGMSLPEMVLDQRS